MLIDFSYYEETYVGTADEAAFTPAARKAEAVMDSLTFHHIIRKDGAVGQMVDGVFTELTADELNALKMGLCALTDAVLNVNNARNKALSGNSEENIKSVSSGGESITYGAAATAYDDALKDHAAEMNLYRNTLLLYAAPEMFTVNPFYAGVR